jgi:hypothetical protein
VPVHSPDADARVVGDLVERHLGAALGEQLARGVEDVRVETDRSYPIREMERP